MTGWLILAYVVTLVAAMAGSFALAIRLSRSTIQASKDLLESTGREIRLARELLAEANRLVEMEKRLAAIEKVLDSLDTNVGTVIDRLSDGGHLRVTQPPKGIGPRGRWGGGDEGTGHSGTPA